MVQVFYHKNCSDGICSAWAMRYAGNTNGYYYEGLDHSFKLLDKKMKYIENNEVYFLDICPPISILTKISKIAKKIVIIDHHESVLDNIEAISGLTNITLVFSVKKSGCKLTWEHFHKNRKSPWFLDYIEDRDLWKFILPDSKYITDYLYNHGYMHMNVMDVMMTWSDSMIKHFMKNAIKISSITIKYKNKLINKCVNKSIETKLMNHRIWICTDHYEFRSEVGEKLCKTAFSDGKFPYCAAVVTINMRSNSIIVSLRSLGDNNVKKIATEFDGGGHPNASSFTLSLDQFASVFF